MARIDIVREAKLFLKVPAGSPEASPPPDGHLQSFLHGLENKTSYNDLLDQTYYLIRNGDLSIRELLKIWELRLTLHLFNGQLTFAKREAIQLNNALYLEENRTTNIMRQEEMQRGLQPIYPLPKNNEGLIHHDLMVLLLRLKSMPNTTLINELYKLNYQLRLKSMESGIEQTKKRCVNLSYEIVVILLINKNYITLLNLLQSIDVELQSEIKNTPADTTYHGYNSNVHLLIVIIHCFIFKYQSKDPKDLERLVGDHFAAVDLKSLSALCCALEQVEPTIPVEASTELENKSLPAPPVSHLSLSTLIDMVYSDRITTRIVCALLAVWDLTNRFNFRLDTHAPNSDPSSHHSVGLIDDSVPKEAPLEECARRVAAHWPNYIQKVYGLE